MVQVEKNALMQVDIGDKIIRAKLKGKIYKNKIKVMFGDEVEVLMVPNSETHYIVKRL